MRKVKKINGYLIVKFNDRERRDWEQLGAYGVIDAELYTGTLEVDRDAMEYEDAETLEAAVEQARYLENEVDIPEAEPSFTIVTETNDRFTEEEVFPQLLINGWTTQLKAQVESRHHTDIDPRTAAHELYGFKVALNRLGLLENDETFVLPNTFGQAEERPLPRNPEELLAHICDEVCKERIPERTQEELEAVCAKCAVERLADEADARELRARTEAHRKLNEQIDRFKKAMSERTAKRVEYGARKYLEAMADGGLVTEREAAAFEAAITDAVAAMPTRARETFEHLPPKPDGEPINPSRTRAVYALGRVLEGGCPDNDCRVYLNIFRMARELDEAMDTAQGYTADTLQRALFREYRELARMYATNYAVQKFKEGMKA